MNAPTVPLLTLNAAPGRLRFAYFIGGGARALGGAFVRLGRSDAQLEFLGGFPPRPLEVDSPAGCLPILFQLLDDRKMDLPGIVAHRVLHGGPDYFEPVAVTPRLLDDLELAAGFAPDDVPLTLEVMREARRYWTAASQVACFDTGFHHSLPTVARLLPLPRTYADQGIRRYGFHGLAFTSVLAELRHRCNGALPARLILIHLDEDASVATLRQGRCIDTSMGFTPAGGLVMGTRTGDLDPGLLAFLMQRDKLSAAALASLVSRESGLLGLSELSADIRVLLDHESTDLRAAEALAVFVHQARKTLGAAIAVLGGVDAIVFSGSVGETSAAVRTRLCADFDYVGLALDPDRNRISDPVISEPESRVDVHVITADEDAALATAARDFLAKSI